METMHVLVTGGAGFIGSHSVDLLLASGARVRVLDNFSSGRRENLVNHTQMEIITGDIRDKVAVDAALAGITHVLHLAANVSVVTSVEQPLTSAAVNLTGFLNVLEGARQQGVQRMVYASSAAVYGVPVKLPVDEAMLVAPISPYGLEKFINDQYAALYQELYDFSAMGLRYFNVYGPRQDPSSPYSGVISIFERRLRDGKPLTIYGDGQQTRDYIYVGDVARANIAALRGVANGVCNVATGRTVTLLDMLDTLATVAGVTPVVSHGEARTGDIRHSSAVNAKLRTVLKVDGFTSLREGMQQLWTAGV
jgi:UDP-glucose 4-epimerase